MQSDLPWNVAGIPPEAREAARAAARREGLSVGEWLTRRILRSLTDTEPASGWRREVDYSEDDYEDTPAAAAPQARRAARAAEPEPPNVYRRIEEQLRGLGKRLEAQEKSQTESSRVVSQAAAEINSAAREQAQAFEHMGSHVVGLSERLARVERDAPSDGFKEAVKSLHAGLTRLAEQINENNAHATNQISALANKLETVAGNTNLLSNRLEAVAGNTNQSAGQIAALTAKLEAVAGKIGDVRSEAEHSARSLTGKLEAVAGKISDVRNETEHSSRALAQRIASFDDRVRASEAASQALADRLDKTIAGLEAARSTRAADQAESARQALIITQLSDTLHGLSQRISSSEAQTAGAMARVEHQIVESRHSEQPVDRRLQGIEHALSDIAGRLDRAERNAAGSARAVEDNLRNVSARLDAADKRHHEAISELQTAVSQPPPPPVFAAPPVASVSPSAASLVTPPPVTAAPPSFAPSPISPLLDLPPFPEAKDPHPDAHREADAPETTSATAAPETPAATNAAAIADVTSAPEPKAEEPMSTDGLPIIPGPQHSETADSYIAAARRSARAASTADAAAQPGMRGPLGGFTWGAPPISR
jgi:localization factor PodJL